jgi:hypothetical protein
LDHDLSQHVQVETSKESNSLEQEASELDTKIDKDEVVCEERAPDNGEMEQFELINEVSTNENKVKSIFKVMFAYSVKPAHVLLGLSWVIKG